VLNRVIGERNAGFGGRQATDIGTLTRGHSFQ
jgi:hypothetical protein